MSNIRRPRGSSAQSPQSSPRATQVVVAVVALLCVVAVSAIALALPGNGGSTPAASGGISTAPSSAAQSTAPSSAPPSGLHCTQAPAPNPKPQSFASAPSPSLARHATWNATIATNCGDIRIQLNGKAAPQTVASFIFLARKGFFDKSPCQRLTTSGLYVLQCGDPTGTGTGGPGYGFGIENAPEQGAYPAGTVAMARTSSPTSNGSQFFVVYQDTALPTEGGGYSIFGKVTKGLGIVKALAQAGVTGGGADGAPAQPISILHVFVKEA